MKKFLVCFSIIFLVTSSMAQTIVTDRPNQTDASLTVPKKSLQIESGVRYTNTDLTNSDFVERNILLPTSLFRVGLTQQIELRLLSQVELNSIAQYGRKDPYIAGFSNLEVGTKIQLFRNENSIHQVAIVSNLGVPTGSIDINESEVYTVSKLCVSHQFSEDFNLGYNLGYSAIGGIENFIYSVACGFSINEKLGLYCEPFGSFNLDRTFKRNYEVSFDAGLTYLLNDNTQFDWSFGTGIDGRKMNYIAAGCSWLIK